jgi:hypothetical protein
MTRLLLISAVLFLDSSHLPAPIALAWGHTGFRRRIALAHKVKYIAVPLIVLALTTLTVPVTLIFWPGFHPVIGRRVGAALDRNVVNPFTITLTLFMLWNFYHYGSQNFGLWRLWRRGRGRRRLQRASCVGGTIAGMIALPRIAPVLLPFEVLLHGLPAIWLAAKASRRPILFWLAMLLIGAIITGALVAGVLYGSLAIAMVAVATRVGLGLVHFLYDRWVWRLSDPRVWTIIGGDIFSPQHNPFRV